MAYQNEDISQAVSLLLPYLSLLSHKVRYRRLSLVGLFSIGFLLIAVAIARLPIYGNGTSQFKRNTWGSVEEFAAAFVANVPTIFALRNPPVTADNTSFHNKHHSEMAGFRNITEEGITVTRCIELRRDTIESSKYQEGFEVMCVEQV
jgi:hypothetical protein